MNLDQYREVWKADAAQTRVTIDTELLTKVQQNQQSFRSSVFWRDVREAGISLVLIPIWLVMGLTMSSPWTWYLTIPALIWLAGFVFVDRRRHPQRPGEPGEPLLYCVKESLTQVDHQIWLLRNIFWWYLLPFCISILAFFFHVAWDNSNTSWEFVLSAGSRGLIVLVICWGIYRLNQFAVRSQLEPRRQDLMKVIASLEGEASDEASDENGGDIMELVSALVDPIQNSGQNSDWAGNWNQIIPSWRVAAAIILPTLAGALCGLYSGLCLPMYDMGPTLFQTVVGAVIPFEISLFWIIWRSWKKKQSLTDPEPVAAGNSERATGFDLVDSVDDSVDDEATKKPESMPRAPAIVIIFLILFLSVMAFVAIYSCVSEERNTSSTRDALRQMEPDFGEISAFDDRDIARVDEWLQKQVELARYPSLTVAIVRDGEIVYGKALGFENVKSGRKATLQTQYHVASVTKAFTATLAVMLHEQAVVNLDQPVATYLPKDVSISTTPEVGATITLRQLASHTSGLPRGVPGRVQSARGWYELEPQRLYKHLAKVKMNADPGEAEEYSNLGFGLLGHVLELAADKSLNELLQEMICDPLKLERTAIQADDTLHPATGYDDSGLHFRESHSFRQRLAGSGGLVASVEDLSKFLAAQMQPGVFTAEMLRELHTRTKRSDGIMIETTLGWSSGYNAYIGRFLKKNGGRSNCSAWIGYSTEHKLGVAVVTNCGGPDVDSIGEWLLERSVPGAFKPVREFSYAKVAPYSGVRWKNDRPIVRVQDRWSPLVSINGIPIEHIMEFANQEFRDTARKRFTEDLVELLSKMGHEPDWVVTLGLEIEDGRVEQLEVRMTERNRRLARD